jgi:protein-L-isoaspartate(D-aspartate) O-methyltransferase
LTQRSWSGCSTVPRFEARTGVTYGPKQSLEWLYLWLASVLDTGLCSMSVEQAAVDADLVNPMFRSTTMMAVPSHGTLAYLTWRLTGHTENGGKIMEGGVIGHGDTAAELTDRVADQVRTWSTHHRDRTVQFEILPTGTHASDTKVGRVFLDRPHHPITVIWQ